MYGNKRSASGIEISSFSYIRLEHLYAIDLMGSLKPSTYSKQPDLPLKPHVIHIHNIKNQQLFLAFLNLSLRKGF